MFEVLEIIMLSFVDGLMFEDFVVVNEDINVYLFC